MCILFVGKATEFSPDGSPLKMVGSHIDITSQKCRERNLLRLNNLLNETSKTAMVGGWEFEVAGEELNWTDFTKEIFEVEQSFIPQKGDITSKFALPAYSERIKSVFNSAATEGTSFDIDFPIVTARGNRKWIRCTCKSTFDGSKCVRLFGVVQDVTEKKMAREELLMKEQQLSTFIKNCPVAICMLDSEMNYIAASDIWKSFFDLNADEIRGTNHFEIFTQTPEVWKERYQKALQGEVLKMDEESFVLPDGQVEWLEWEIRPWYEVQGQIGGIIIFTAVISEKQAFKEALIHAKEQAEKASLLKSGFLSVMSHEMRTPLNAVIGFINLLLQSPRPDQVENMNVLRFSAENLLLLINDVLDFSKLDAERVQWSVQPFNLAALVGDIVASLKHEADKKGLELKLVADQAVPEFIVGDSARLGQIILNLANNAVKFTHEGSVSISYVLKENNAGSVVIGFEVRDNGIGIPLEQQENIFDMFSQADSDTTRKYGGTGLGLTISKRLLELMGSEIHLTSMPEKGSAFSFDITFCNTEQPQATENETENFPEILHGARILIVEDNPVNILLMSKFLSQWK
jgi:PAS domain S-box-containing protein